MSSAVCSCHNRPLDDDGRCPLCDHFDALDDERRKKNVDKPIEWKIQLMKQKTGSKKYLVRKCQGSYDLDEATVSYTWSSHAGPDPFGPRVYSNQKWSCSCGMPDCIHVIQVKENGKRRRRST